MNHYCYTWIEEWCIENGWTDLFLKERNEFWAFPPNAVMPLPIPGQALRLIKTQRGLSQDEKYWCIAAVLATALCSIAGYFSHSPMPLVMAFAFCAVTVALMEVED